jgi:hypothetical protein
MSDTDKLAQAARDTGKALAYSDISDWMKTQPEYILKETLLEYMIEKVKELV